MDRNSIGRASVPITVPPQEPDRLPPRIAFVAEAPSHEEERELQPLVGPSGRIFNTMLKAAGLRREEFAITNVFNEKLPDNDVANWCVPVKQAEAEGIKDIPPIGKAGILLPKHRHHLDRLREELERWQPIVIVPLGGTALWAFTGQTSISAVRGTILAATRIAPGTKLLPTFHPAAIMHQYKLMVVVIGDLMRAMTEANRGPKIVLPERKLFLEPTLEDLYAHTDMLTQTDLLSVDVETYADQVTNIGFAPSSKYALNVPFVDRRVPDLSYWQDPMHEVAAWSWVRDILVSPVPKLGQNFPYDAVRMLRKYHIAPRNYREDTRLLHHAIYPELPKDLQFLGSSYSTQGAWKYWGKASEKKDD